MIPDYDPPHRRLFRCSDRMCGGLDCANCYGEAAVIAYLRELDEGDEADAGEANLPGDSAAKQTESEPKSFG